MRHTAIVTEIESLAPSIIQLTVSFSTDFAFAPGQWVNFRFPEGVSRAYTIASAPQRPEAVQLCVRVGAGRGGEALRKLEPGAEVQIDGPYGDFLLPDDPGGVVFLAGDVGIAPVRSIVLHLLAVKDPRRIVVLYEPDQRHILYAADFDPLARAGDIVHESGPIETSSSATVPSSRNRSSWPPASTPSSTACTRRSNRSTSTPTPPSPRRSGRSRRPGARERPSSAFGTFSPRGEAARGEGYLSQALREDHQ